MIGKTLLHYHILEKLGEGGMGVVYKAQDNRLNRQVAIKFLPEYVKAEQEEHRRFKLEAQAAAGLNHYNITTIYTIEETNDVTFIVMEYVEGQELRHFIRAGNLTIDEIVKIAIQIADGLLAAHEKGIVHRDIKSANIMLNKKGRVKIMDFGLAKMAGQAHVTKAGTTLGTISYMSPEQSRGESVDLRSDIWSFGVVLYEMVAGALPFRGDYEAAVLYAILNEEPPPLNTRAGIPPQLIEIIKRTLQKKADNRYESFSEVLEVLYALQPNGNLQVPPKETDTVAPQRRPSSSSHLTSTMAERRQVTSLFCRLIPLSPLQPIDPEDLHETLPKFYDLCDKVVSRFDGHISPLVGEGVQVFFGYPQAHEDDARRAAMAGLAIIEGVQKQNEQRAKLGDAELAAQVGIHTGLVVFGLKAESGSQSVVGDVPEIATRLANLAAPNTLLSSQACFQLIDKFFDYEDIGELSVIGLVQPLHLYQVLHQSAVRTSIDMLAEDMPLIGRARELDMLRGHWEALVEDGEGRVVCLRGDAGLGKTHLVRAFKEHIRQNPKAWLTEVQGSAFHSNTPLHPIIEALQRTVLRFEAHESNDDRLKKIEGFLAQYGLDLAVYVPLFANLLSVPFAPNYKPLEVTPERQKQMAYDAFVNILLSRAKQQPLLYILEDLHWLDPSTLEFLTKLVELGPTSRIFFLFTYRPDFTPPWPARSHIDVINLIKLKQKSVLEIIDKVTGGKKLPEELAHEIYSKTDGVPLFVEELTKSVLESGLVVRQNDHYALSGKNKELAIPATLRDSLTARLDRLGTAKEVAQLGAVIGREFSTELLKTILPGEENVLLAELDKLVEAELLYKNAALPNTFIFKHALIQEAAYESILKKTRYGLHENIANAIRQLTPEIENIQPEVSAFHFTQAGKAAQALPLWLRAGQIAYSRSTMQEAVIYFKKGLALLTGQPETPETLQQELLFLLNLGMALIAIKGYTDPEVEKAFTRAREICAVFGEVPQLFPALWGLWAFYIVRREFDKAHELGDEMMRLADHTNDADLLLEAHTSHVLNFFYSRGDFETVYVHLQKAAALYSPDKHQAHVALYLQDPGVVTLSHLCWVQWILGDVDDAQKTCEQVIKLAEEVNHPYSFCYALVWAGVFYHFRLEPEKTLAFADRALAVATENIFPNWIADAEMIRGWALARLGRAEEGIPQLQHGALVWHAIGARLWQTHVLGLHADAYLVNGQFEDGLTTVSEALETAEKVKETYYEAELWRLKGELLLKQSIANAESAESCYLKAKEIARRQNAKMFELRAVVQLAKLRQGQNKSKAAVAELQSVLEHISQGEKTVDMIAAKALLGELKDIVVPTPFDSAQGAS